MDIAAIWKAYARAKGKRKLRLRNELAEHYAGTVRAAARRFAKRTPQFIEEDELYSAASAELLLAIPRFDPGRGVLPRTFFARRISGAMSDYCRELDRVSRTFRGRINKVAALRDALHREPTDQEIATELEVPESTAGDYRRAPRQHSLDREIDYHGLKLADQIPAPDDNAGELREAMVDALKSCSRTDRLIITLYHLEGWKMRAIGKHLGISESRVSQRHAEIMGRLRRAHAPTRKWAA